MKNNELQIFSNPQFGDIRAIEKDGEPWFVAVDVCKALDIDRTQTRRLDDDEKGVYSTQTPGGDQDLTYVNEPGLYALVLGSRKPEAKAFKRWITHEVIPAIRKTGGYIAGQEYMTDAEIMARALLVAQNTIQQRDARIKHLEGENAALSVDKAIMQPKADYFDDLVDRNLLTNFTEAAKQLGIKRKIFIGFMVENGYLYRDKKGNLLPYANKKTEGLFEVKESSNQKTGWAGCQTLLTPKGIETFRLLCQGL